MYDKWSSVSVMATMKRTLGPFFVLWVVLHVMGEGSAGEGGKAYAGVADDDSTRSLSVLVEDLLPPEAEGPVTDHSSSVLMIQSKGEASGAMLVAFQPVIWPHVSWLRSMVSHPSMWRLWRRSWYAMALALGAGGVALTYSLQHRDFSWFNKRGWWLSQDLFPGPHIPILRSSQPQPQHQPLNPPLLLPPPSMSHDELSSTRSSQRLIAPSPLPPSSVPPHQAVTGEKDHQEEHNLYSLIARLSDAEITSRLMASSPFKVENLTAHPFFTAYRIRFFVGFVLAQSPLRMQVFYQHFLGFPPLPTHSHDVHAHHHTEAVASEISAIKSQLLHLFYTGHYTLSGASSKVSPLVQGPLTVYELEAALQSLDNPTLMQRLKALHLYPYWRSLAEIDHLLAELRQSHGSELYTHIVLSSILRLDTASASSLATRYGLKPSHIMTITRQLRERLMAIMSSEIQPSEMKRLPGSDQKREEAQEPTSVLIEEFRTLLHALPPHSLDQTLASLPAFEDIEWQLDHKQLAVFISELEHNILSSHPELWSIFFHDFLSLHNPSVQNIYSQIPPHRLHTHTFMLSAKIQDTALFLVLHPAYHPALTPLVKTYVDMDEEDIMETLSVSYTVERTHHTPWPYFHPDYVDLFFHNHCQSDIEKHIFLVYLLQLGPSRKDVLRDIADIYGTPLEEVQDIALEIKEDFLQLITGGYITFNEYYYPPVVEQRLSLEGVIGEYQQLHSTQVLQRLAVSVLLKQSIAMTPHNAEAVQTFIIQKLYKPVYLHVFLSLILRIDKAHGYDIALAHNVHPLYVRRVRDALEQALLDAVSSEESQDESSSSPS